MAEVSFNDELRGIAECCECEATKSRIKDLLLAQKSGAFGGDAAFGEFKQVGECSIKTGGISVRDYFAAKAMQGQMQREKDFGKTVREQGFSKYAAHIAETSYQLADAMLAERAK